MKSKVLLFNPRSDFYAMPLGLLAVGSALDATRFDVRIFDARIDPHAEARLINEAAGATCVGMTVFSGPPISSALKLSRELKRRAPALPIVWGGWHPSILPEQCVASDVVDAVVIGQGEATFRELLDAMDDRAKWQQIPGLCISAGGGARRTPPRALARMDDFDPVRYELLDVESYFRRKRSRQIDYSSSRGCPYKCTFCADPMVYRSKWTGMPADRVVKELLDLHSRYETHEVSFLDDDLFASLKRIQALVDAFIEAKVAFKWKGAARADELCRLPEPFFDRLQASGCVRINVGAESGSQRVLNRIKKQYRVDQIQTAAQRASRVGIGLVCSFITGFPGETEEDFVATQDLVKLLRRRNGGLETVIYFYSPYPGTELVNELEQQGLRMPAELEEWENFDIEGAWLPRNDPRFVSRVRSLNFYLRHGYSDQADSTSRKLLQVMSRFRCERDWYGFPFERYLAEALSQ